MSTVFKSTGGEWRGQARVRGFPSSSQCFPTYAKAKRWADAQEAELKRLKAPALGIKQVLFSDMCTEYLDSGAFVRQRPGTKRNVEQQVRVLVEHFGHLYLHQIEPAIVEQFKEKRLKTYSKKQPDRLLSYSKIRLELTYLSAVLKLARKRGYLPFGSYFSIDRPVTTPKNVRISASVEARIFEALSNYPDEGQALVFFEMLFGIGCRPGELAALTIDKIDAEKKSFFLTETKNSVPRTVIIPATYFIRLLDWLARPSRKEDCFFVFPSKTRAGKYRQYEYNTAWRYVREFLGPLLPAEITPHAFRHEAISKWCEAGLSDSQLMVLSGHRDAKSLRVYSHLRAEDLRSRLDAISTGYEQNRIDAFVNNHLGTASSKINRSLADALADVKSQFK